MTTTLETPEQVRDDVETSSPGVRKDLLAGLALLVVVVGGRLLAHAPDVIGALSSTR